MFYPFSGKVVASLKKIIAVFSSIAILFALVVPAFAEETSSIKPGSFWDSWAMYNYSLGDTTGGIEGAGFNFLGKLISKAGEDTCQNSDDHLHHGDVVRPVRGGSSATTYTMECKCDYCGELFRVKKTASDLSTAYDDYVQTLPADNINSQGLSEFYITGWTYDASSDYVVIVSSLQDYPCVDSYYKTSSVYPPGSTMIYARSGSFSVPRSGEYMFVFPKAEQSATYPGGKSHAYLSGGSYNNFELGICDDGFNCNVTLVEGTLYDVYVQVGELET